MADLIYRKEAIRVASGYCHPANIAKELAKLPTIDAVEVVFCGDCIHHKDSPVLGTYCEVHDWCSKDEDYCSFAERRADE